LSPAFATWSVRPSGEKASAFGLLPTPACGYGSIEIVRRTELEPVSMTETGSLSVLAT
jgi:hypothetical protein